MWFRRAFFYAMYGAPVVLPLWLVLARTFILRVDEWEIPFLTFAAVVLAAVMAVVSGIVWFRSTVRRERAVSWLDVGVLGAWYLSIVFAGLVDHAAISIPVILIAVVAFWSSIWQLLTETGRRVKSALAGLDYRAEPAQEYNATRRATMAPQSGPTADAPGAGQIIRIESPTDPDVGGAAPN
ncbi:hypothetical protein FB562_0674 [Homoserinimonas aerilata]|uniref:Uncharacterized protein n=1 Tax=Homoserinimonas aerilata TaxID=1162970 RepID=A0A542YHP1_9MICO|nr:hypothetical protein [Homoserinimonas aerilata]TQL47609.1 hypothetical protein FB562_0674 [Homoserinimonas aerilata]